MYKVEVTSNDLSDWLDLAIHAARSGGEVLKKYWGNLQDIKEKDYPGDLVTEADKQSEQVIIQAILESGRILASNGFLQIEMSHELSQLKKIK